jgi:hypothetical protein
MNDSQSELISSYSRAQALEDGVLVDVTNTAKEAGIRLPIAVTRAVWDSCVAVPKGTSCQDENGRLWDLVWMLSLAMRRASGSEVFFTVSFRKGRRNVLTQLKCQCHPGDDLAPVLTVMLPNED